MDSYGSSLSPEADPRGSVEALLRLQSPSGALIASPDFSQYDYCWLRDASFVAYALDLSGEHEASARFHEWAARTIGGIAGVIDSATARHDEGLPLDPALMPPARFGLDGSIVVDDWPNFQVDGYGTWLWALASHQQAKEQPLNPLLREATSRVARYLDAHALSPCFDVWEENGTAVHTSTLGCVYGGLTAAAALLDDGELLERAAEVQSRVNAQGERDGYFTKSSESASVDASTLWLARPFGVVESTDPLFEETVRRIETELVLEGGIRRYPSDTYFGGGAWPVLTASLGWHYASARELDSAASCRDWIAARFDSRGRLAEQFGGERRDPAHYDRWVQRWGLPARELLWSHAMYVVLCAAIDDLQGSAGASPAGRQGTTITKGEGDRS